LSIEQQTEFIEYYLSKHVEVRIREYDQNPSDFGKDFFTLDDTFYVRVIDYPFDHNPDPGAREINDEFLPKFLERLAEYDHSMYQYALMESQTVIPAEYEEEAYRLRNVRLAEKGFLPFEEAVGIYQPLPPNTIQNRPAKCFQPDAGFRPLVPVPLYPAQLLDADNLFFKTLKKISHDNDMLQQIQTEFAMLSNQIIVADRKKIKHREALREIVKKACGYIALGLEILSGKDGKPDADRSAVLIRNFPLSQIFKIGYGLALELKWRAERWRKKSWFQSRNLPLSFWDEEWLGVLGGLLIKKPMFYDNRKTGVLYREFHSTDDVKATETILNEIIAFDDLLSLMAPELEPPPDVLLTHKNLVLTLWARHCLGMPETLLPLPLTDFRRFYDDLWSGKDLPRKTRRSMKESFLNWLSEKTALQPEEITRPLGQTLENLFAEIEDEYGEVSTQDLDPRFISLFLTQN
jgi:hypothetical protein